MADDVILCASELAANAAIHSHSRLPGGTFTVRAKISPGLDRGRGQWRPLDSHRQGPNPAPRVDIVRALASECGIDGDQGGRTIWARFDWTE
jgi:hypothetical protein